LTNEQGVPHYNLPAINEEGEALWSARYTQEDLILRRKQVGEYDWASMFMGEPRPRGGAVFGDTTTYSDADFAKLVADKKIVKYVVGIDCAYTKKTHSDFSVAVVLAIDTEGNAYVVNVRRKQCEPSEFARILKEVRMTYGNPPIYWYTGGQEKEVATFFRNSCGVPVKDVPAREDKFVRAHAAAAAWNSGRLYVPADPKPWADAFVSELMTFTGLDDLHDDQVDALAAAYIPSAGKKVFRGVIKNPLIGF
jgi:predicted phage terminase large subunit-like protein